jgi:predicted secreted protein
MNRSSRCAVASALALLALPIAFAAPTEAPAVQVQPAPSGVLTLSASASAEVQKDLMSITLATSREGDDAHRVQSQLRQALDTALALARAQARPGQLDVRAGDFSVFPRYGDKGRINGWQGNASLVIEGRDMPAIAQLATRLTTLTISNVAYGLSREARAKVEGDATAQAIARYRERAQAMSKQFGYASYTIREVGVSGDEPGPRPMPFALARAKSAMADDAALPVEPGRETVTVTVNGSVQMAP